MTVSRRRWRHASSAAVVACAILAGCSGAPVEEGAHPGDWGVGAAQMTPEERAQMSQCTRFASWPHCRAEMLGLENGP